MPGKHSIHHRRLRKLGFEYVPGLPVDIPGIDTLVRLGMKTKQYEQALQGLSEDIHDPRNDRPLRPPWPTMRPALWVVKQMPEVPRASSRRQVTLPPVCTAAFMLLLDITIVSVALPSIQRDLRASWPTGSG